MWELWAARSHHGARHGFAAAQLLAGGKKEFWCRRPHGVGGDVFRPCCWQRWWRSCSPRSGLRSVDRSRSLSAALLQYVHIIAKGEIDGEHWALPEWEWPEQAGASHLVHSEPFCAQLHQVLPHGSSRWDCLQKWAMSWMLSQHGFMSLTLNTQILPSWSFVQCGMPNSISEGELTVFVQSACRVTDFEQATVKYFWGPQRRWKSATPWPLAALGNHRPGKDYKFSTAVQSQGGRYRESAPVCKWGLLGKHSLKKITTNNRKGLQQKPWMSATPNASGIWTCKRWWEWMMGNKSSSEQCPPEQKFWVARSKKIVLQTPQKNNVWREKELEVLCSCRVFDMSLLRGSSKRGRSFLCWNKYECSKLCWLLQW